jgi:hypothetical protein
VARRALPEQRFTPHAATAPGCDRRQSLAERVDPDCVFGPNRRRTPTAVLVGDSNALHLSEAVIGAAEAAGGSVTLAPASGCPFIDVPMLRFGELDTACRSYAAGTLAHLLATRPDTVVIGSATDYFIEDSRFAFPLADGDTATSPEQKAQVVAAGLQASMRTLTDAGIRVVLVRSIPKLVGWDPRSCAAVLWHAAEERCGRTISREAAMRPTHSRRGHGQPRSRRSPQCQAWSPWTWPTGSAPTSAPPGAPPPGGATATAAT